MTETSSEKFARQVLESWGLDVARLAAGSGRSADYLAAGEGDEYIVEVTEKEPTAAFEALKAETLGGGFASMSRPVTPWNLLDAKIRDKHKQISGTPRRQDSLTVLWYYAPRGEGPYHTVQLERTLLGVVLLIDRSSRPPPVRCFFYNHFVFYKTPNLDAVIGGNESGLLMWVNPLSARLESMRRSGIYRLLAEGNSVVDPELLEARGSAIRLPMDVDRSHEGDKKKALTDLYGIDPVVMQEQQFSGLMSLPSDPGGQSNGPPQPPPAPGE